MKLANWIIGLIIILSLLTLDILLPISLYYKWFYVLLLACFLTLLRLSMGPTTSDRAASVKVLSVIVIGFCGILSALCKQHIYIDIAIAWAFQAFVGTVVLAKYIEGKPLDD
ncbi:MAG: monovalent cation/H+ antiporter complex subunit F [Elusimicrobia bacterium]|nr:monovalent cation/H+ antiporter complex subunit F [Elusimicrobiota bacterium]